MANIMEHEKMALRRNSFGPNRTTRIAGRNTGDAGLTEEGELIARVA